MGCGWHRSDMERWQQHAADRWERKRERWERKMQHWGGGHRGGLRPTGNRAFDEYRQEALRRLEDEAAEFREFLQRLRMAKDRQEFDEFMRQRRNSPDANQAGGGEPEPRPQA